MKVQIQFAKIVSGLAAGQAESSFSLPASLQIAVPLAVAPSPTR
jgi:hypothetical protein